jgi:hypothetical protein
MVNTPDESWALDFAADRGVAGFVRLARVGDRCWYWCYLVGEGVGLVAVRDHDVAPPRRPDVLEVRADALWAELVCETPGEHWSVGLEAFGVRLDDPLDAWPVDLRAGEIGERVAVGLDLEWESDVAGAPHGIVHGDVLLERDRYELDGFGTLAHAVSPDTAWPTEWTGSCRFADGQWRSFAGGLDATDPGARSITVPGELRLDDGTLARCEPLAVVPVPLEPGAGRRGPALVRVLTHVDPPRNGGTFGEVTGTGWVEMVQS